MDEAQITIESATTRAGGRPRCIRPWIVPAALVFLLFTGCASVAPPASPGPSWKKTEESSRQQGWWYARFVTNWPPDAEPSWHVDLVLAHRVVSPCLTRYENEIKLWRFHRRAVRDQAGHQFSFVFYSNRETAQVIFAALRADPTLQLLRAKGLVIRDSYDDPDSVIRPNLEDTSDPGWSDSVRKSWPYFIQGVSRMWLNLIADVSEKASAGNPPAGIDETLDLYVRINLAVETMWREEGQHAFLHHLNAVFEYQPLVMRHHFLLGF